MVGLMVRHREKLKTILVQPSTSYDLTGIALQLLQRTSWSNPSVRLVQLDVGFRCFCYADPSVAYPDGKWGGFFRCMYGVHASNLISSSHHGGVLEYDLSTWIFSWLFLRLALSGAVNGDHSRFSADATECFGDSDLSFWISEYLQA